MDVATLYKLMTKQRVPDTTTVQSLISTYPDLLNDKFDNNDDTLLIRATKDNHKIIVELLCASKLVDLNATNEYKNTALIISVLFDLPDIALVLIDAGADITIKENNDKTAYDFINWIKDQTKRTEVKNKLEPKMYQTKILPTKSDISVNQLWDLLQKHPEDLEWISPLIDKHKNILNDPWYDSNLLMRSIIVGNSSYNRIVEKLLSYKVDLNYQTVCGKDTALILAIYWNRPDVANLLIDAGADITLIDSDGKAAFDYIDKIRDEISRKEIREKLEAKMPVKTPAPQPETKPEAKSEAKPETQETVKPNESTPEPETPIIGTIIFMMKNKINFIYKDGSIVSTCITTQVDSTTSPIEPSSIKLVSYLIDQNTNFTYTDGKFTINK